MQPLIPLPEHAPLPRAGEGLGEGTSEATCHVIFEGA